MNCEVCGYDLVVDKHHWSKTEISILCPNCHAIYERIIRWKTETLKSKKNPNDFGYTMNDPYYEYDAESGLYEAKRKVRKYYKKRYGIPKIRKYLDNGEPRKTYAYEGVAGDGKTYGGLTIFGCAICNFDKVIDSHHFGNKDCDKGKFFGRASSHRSNRESIILCPNHHAILHRLLKDKDGTKYNSKNEIIENINKYK